MFRSGYTAMFRQYQMPNGNDSPEINDVASKAHKGHSAQWIAFPVLTPNGSADSP